MSIFIATDHAGFELKEILVPYLRERGYTVEDCGARTLDPNDDYPAYIKLVGEKVAADPLSNRGIVLGGSGQGEAMVANHVSGVRAALYYGGPLDIIRLSRAHNDANVLSLGARFLTHAEAKEAATLWLETPFSGEERHVRRIASIE
jgi:ribose 5-phosphate isomerase B